MQDIDKALDDADFATEDVPICLKGSLVKEWERAEQAVVAAQGEFDDALAKGLSTAEPATGRTAALAAFEEVQARMEAASITFRVTGIDEAAWKAVLIKHPPRPEVHLDMFFGYNTLTASRDLVRACLVDPAVNDAQWERVTKRLNLGQMQRLVTAVTNLNQDTDGAIPFSSAVFEAIRSSGETSRSPETSESAPAVSGGGRPRKKAKASGTPSPAT